MLFKILSQISPTTAPSISMSDVFKTMSIIAESFDTIAEYGAEGDNSISIPGFDTTDGQDEKHEWSQETIATVSIEHEEDIALLRSALKKLSTSNKAKIDCSCSIQLIFLLALFEVFKDDTSLLHILQTISEDWKTFQISPAGAFNIEGKKSSMFQLAEEDTYLTHICFDEEKYDLSTLAKEHYNLYEGLIFYVSNDDQYEKDAPNGAWSGEWCILNEIDEGNPDNSSAFGFGLGAGAETYINIKKALKYHATKAKKKTTKRAQGKNKIGITDILKLHPSAFNELFNQARELVG